MASMQAAAPAEPEPEPEPEPERLAVDSLSEDEFNVALRSLQKARVVCDNQYDTVRLDSRTLLQEDVLLDLFTKCTRDARLVKPAEELMAQCLTMSTPLPITDEMVGVIVCACAERGRLPGAMHVVNAAARGTEHCTPKYALGVLVEMLLQEEGPDPAHDAFVFYQMMLHGGHADEMVPWQRVDKLCCAQLRLAKSLSKPLVDITFNEAENERKMWLRRTVGILEEYRSARVQPGADIVELLNSPAWENSDTSCWDYIVDRGWATVSNLIAWLEQVPLEPARLSCAMRPDMVVTIQHGEVEITDDLAELYAMEPPATQARVKQLLKLLEAKSSQLELPAVDVVLEGVLALKCPHPSVAHLAECVVGKKYFMQRYTAFQYKLAQENKKMADEELRAESIEQKAVFIQLSWRAKIRRRQQETRRRTAQLILMMQRRVKTRLFFNYIKRKVARRKLHNDKKWERLQLSFVKDWPRISKGRRVEVHLPSLSLPEHHRFAGELNIGAREDLQLGRLVARALDPNVFVRLSYPSVHSRLQAQHADPSVALWLLWTGRRCRS